MDHSKCLLSRNKIIVTSRFCRGLSLKISEAFTVRQIFWGVGGFVENNLKGVDFIIYNYFCFSQIIAQ